VRLELVESCADDACPQRAQLLERNIQVSRCVPAWRVLAKRWQRYAVDAWRKCETACLPSAGNHQDSWLQLRPHQRLREQQVAAYMPQPHSVVAVQRDPALALHIVVLATHCKPSFAAGLIAVDVSALVQAVGPLGSEIHAGSTWRHYVVAAYRLRQWIPASADDEVSGNPVR